MKVSAIKRGAVNAEVDLDLSGGQQIVATITNASVDHLGLAVGSEALALFNASSIILAVKG